MQTLPSLRSVRDLRAVSSGPSPGRRRTRSMHGASTWKGASPLPDQPRPTEPVGSPPPAGCGGSGGAFAFAFALPSRRSARSAAKRSPGAFPGSCLTPPEPTCAVGSRTAARCRPAEGDRHGLRAGRRVRRQRDRCPRAGAGPLPARAVRWARIGVPFSADPRQRGARTSGPQWALSAGLSLHPRPQPFGGRSEGGGTGGALVRRQNGNGGHRHADARARIGAAGVRVPAEVCGAPTVRAAWKGRERPAGRREARVLSLGPPRKGR